MKKKTWKKGMIVLGVALLSAAVALMPACESGDSVDACESLTGDWELTLTSDGLPCGGWEDELPVGEYEVTIEIAGSEVSLMSTPPSVLITIPVEHPPIVCDGRKFEITYWDFEGFCAGTGTYTQRFIFSGAFTSADEFTGTVYVYDFAPPGCGEPDPAQNCDFTYTVAGKRK